MINPAALNAAIRDYFVDIVRPNNDLSPGVVQIATPGPELALSDSPPVIVLSFAERIRELADAMTPLKQRPEPKVMTVIDCYDAFGDDTYLGKMYVDAASGREYKFVQHDGKTVYL